MPIVQLAEEGSRLSVMRHAGEVVGPQHVGDAEQIVRGGQPGLVTQRLKNAQRLLVMVQRRQRLIHV